jgi:hypothetical protein
MTDVTAHEHLIRTLVDDLRPVRRLSPPPVRASYWLLMVLAAAIALGSVADMEAVWRRVTAAPDMWLAAAGSVLTAILAAWAAFELSVPDRKPAWALLPLPPMVLWVAASGLGCLRSTPVSGTHVAPLAETKDCLIFIVGLSIPLSALLVVMLRRACPLRPDLTAALGGLAAAAAAASLLNLFHPFDAAAVDLGVHALAVGLVVAANRMLAGRIMGSRRAERELVRR